jgi:hypothetical protein
VKTNILLSLICLLAFCYLGTYKAYSYFFEDNFNESSLNLTKWNYYEDYDSTIKFENGNLTVPAFLPSYKIPFVYSRIHSVPQEFILEYKFKYSALSGNGLGLILANTNFDIENFMQDDFQYRVFSMWQENSSTSPFPLRFQIFASGCNRWVFECQNTSTLFLNQSLNDTNDYKVVITKIGHTLTFSVTNTTTNYIYNFLPVVLDNNIMINSIFIGHPPLPEMRNNGQKFWSTLNIDYIHVTDLNPIPAPIIFLPGYMGSWNWEDMRDNTSTHVWGPNPVAKIYDNFLGTLSKLGRVEGTDFVRWDYDFRRPLPEISAKFSTFLNNFLSTKPEGTRVILIGHSFGGLVAKQYLVDNPSNFVEKIITVGSPHEGVLDTYPLVAGGDMLSSDIWQKMGFEVMGLLHGKTF